MGKIPIYQIFTIKKTKCFQIDQRGKRNKANACDRAIAEIECL